MTVPVAMVQIEAYAVVETSDDHCLVIWHEKDGERKFAMYFSPAALSMYFTAMNRGEQIAHGMLYEICRRHVGLRLERIEFPRTEGTRFVAQARFRKPTDAEVVEELKCSDAVSLGLYAKVPFLMENSIVAHASLLSAETIRSFEEHLSHSRLSMLSGPFDDPPDGMPLN